MKDLQDLIEHWWRCRKIYQRGAALRSVAAEFGARHALSDEDERETLSFEATGWAHASRVLAERALHLVNIEPLLRLAIDLEEEARSILEVEIDSTVLSAREKVAWCGGPPTVDVVRAAQAAVESIETRSKGQEAPSTPRELRLDVIRELCAELGRKPSAKEILAKLADRGLPAVNEGQLSKDLKELGLR